MEKLTIKEIAPYLPFGLKYCNTDHPEYTFNILHLSDRYVELMDDESGFEKVYFDEPSYLKPILRPLSDLTKEIEHNGERFVPIDRISIYPMSGREYNMLLENLKTGMTEYIVTQMCISWYFDVFSLIPQGLAIDINQLS